MFIFHPFPFITSPVTTVNHLPLFYRLLVKWLSYVYCDKIKFHILRWREVILAYAWVNLNSLVAQTVKCLPTRQETRVQSLGREDLLKKEMATHSSILAWKIPRMEEPDRLQFMGSQRVGHNCVISLFKIAYGLSNIHCTSALIIKGKGTLTQSKVCPW